MQDTEGNTVLRKDLDFQKVYLEGLLLSFVEAKGTGGLLSEYEDLIDAMFRMFPSSKKRIMKVYNEDCTELRPVLEEWKKAKALGPPIGDKRLLGSSDDARDLKVQVRDRCLRKAQIVTDVAEKLKLIGEEFEDAEQEIETSEVMQKVSRLAGQVR